MSVRLMNASRGSSRKKRKKPGSAPTATVTVTNTDEQNRRFRVRLLVVDTDVPDKAAVRSEYPTLESGRSATFEDVALGWPYAGSPPAFEPASCLVEVYNAG